MAELADAPDLGLSLIHIYQGNVRTWMYETHPAEGDCRGVSKRSRRKLYMERMYEVLRFIEHGPLCRQCMDCVSGALLLDYLKVHSQMEKQTILTWFRQLSVCVDQYQRS